jgi:hypothetical protein
MRLHSLLVKDAEGIITRIDDMEEGAKKPLYLSGLVEEKLVCACDGSQVSPVRFSNPSKMYLLLQIAGRKRTRYSYTSRFTNCSIVTPFCASFMAFQGS